MVFCKSKLEVGRWNSQAVAGPPYFHPTSDFQHWIRGHFMSSQENSIQCSFWIDLSLPKLDIICLFTYYYTYVNFTILLHCGTLYVRRSIPHATVHVFSSLACGLPPFNPMSMHRTVDEAQWNTAPSMMEIPMVTTTFNDRRNLRVWGEGLETNCVFEEDKGVDDVSVLDNSVWL